jgi:serine/threonine-protein kinase RsbW
MSRPVQTRSGGSVELKLTLALPQDSLSIPVVRKTLGGSMAVLGVDEGCCADIEVAISEACTNVLNHTVEGDQYEVVCCFDEQVCVIEVIDRGHGFDGESLGRVDAEPTAERGRGIQLMRALVDNIRFESKPERGTVVRFEKRLEWSDDAPVKQLRASSRSMDGDSPSG